MKALLLVLLVVPLISLTGCLKDDADGSALFPAGPASGGVSSVCGSPRAGAVDDGTSNCPTASGKYTIYEYYTDSANPGVVSNTIECNIDAAGVPADQAAWELSNGGNPIQNFKQGANCISGTSVFGTQTLDVLYVRAN